MGRGLGMSAYCGIDGVFQPVYGDFQVNQKDNASILVVDDDMFVRESTASFLKNAVTLQSHVRVPGMPCLH